MWVTFGVPVFCPSSFTLLCLHSYSDEFISFQYIQCALCHAQRVLPFSGPHNLRPLSTPHSLPSARLYRLRACAIVAWHRITLQAVLSSLASDQVLQAYVCAFSSCASLSVQCSLLCSSSAHNRLAEGTALRPAFFSHILGTVIDLSRLGTSVGSLALTFPSVPTAHHEFYRPNLLEMWPLFSFLFSCVVRFFL
jgi:hypothetical protein